jgi:hypothetical protein
VRVRMLVKISGGRGDGSDWPAPGDPLEVDDDEGAQLCAAHLAVPVVEERAEKAVSPEVDVETRSPKRSARPKS